MEVVIFIAMMIVPFVSIAALVIAVLNNGKVKALKFLVLTLAKSQDSPQTSGALREFQVRDI